MMLIRKSYFMLRGFLLLIFLSVFGFNLQAQEFPFIKEALKECSLSQDDVSEFRITSDYKDRKAGFRVIWIKQLHQGINIHGADLQLVISREENYLGNNVDLLRMFTVSCKQQRSKVRRKQSGCCWNPKILMPLFLCLKKTEVINGKRKFLERLREN